MDLERRGTLAALIIISASAAAAAGSSTQRADNNNNDNNDNNDDDNSGHVTRPFNRRGPFFGCLSAADNNKNPISGLPMTPRFVRTASTVLIERGGNR